MTRTIFRMVAATALLLAGPVTARAAPAETGQVQAAPGVSIHYERHGTGPNFVLVPNLMAMPEMRALARPDRTLVLYDMRNRGRSGRVEDLSAITIMGDVDDVEALRRHFGAERLSLVGYSYLGLMVALYAVRFPDRVERLVQIGAVPRRFGTAYPPDQTAGLSTLDAAGRAAESAWRSLRENPPAGTTPLALCRAQRHYLAFLLVGNPANQGRVPDTCVHENESIANQTRHLEAHFGDIQRRDFPREPFTTLAVPVLTIHGTLDRNAPYGSGLEWATTFRDARLITVEGGAHQAWLDDPTVIGDIDRFLGGEWPARAQRFGRE